jgi:hypothetical protein
MLMPLNFLIAAIRTFHFGLPALECPLEAVSKLGVTRWSAAR